MACVEATHKLDWFVLATWLWTYSIHFYRNGYKHTEFGLYNSTGTMRANTVALAFAALAIAASASPPVRVSLETGWAAPPLVLEIL